VGLFGVWFSGASAGSAGLDELDPLKADPFKLDPLKADPDELDPLTVRATLPRKSSGPPRTRQSPVTLATFPSWGSWPG